MAEHRDQPGAHLVDPFDLLEGNFELGSLSHQIARHQTGDEGDDPADPHPERDAVPDQRVAITVCGPDIPGRVDDRDGNPGTYRATELEHDGSLEGGDAEQRPDLRLVIEREEPNETGEHKPIDDQAGYRKIMCPGPPIGPPMKQPDGDIRGRQEGRDP
jgi:hypothetical protein